MHLFVDRHDAGRRLAEALTLAPGALVLGLPRGGVPVAAALAERHGADLDVLVVRKLGAPGQPELALGAIASGGARVLNQELLDYLAVRPEAIARVETAERAELQRRERRYRGERPFPDVTGREVVLVDDGAATGATMRAAVTALHSLGPARLIVALPVASREAAALLEREADAVVCLGTPEPFDAVGRWYLRFGQTSDDEVLRLLEAAGKPTSGGAGAV